MNLFDRLRDVEMGRAQYAAWLLDPKGAMPILLRFDVGTYPYGQPRLRVMRVTPATPRGSITNITEPPDGVTLKPRQFLVVVPAHVHELRKVAWSAMRDAGYGSVVTLERERFRPRVDIWEDFGEDSHV